MISFQVWLPENVSLRACMAHNRILYQFSRHDCRLLELTVTHYVRRWTLAYTYLAVPARTGVLCVDVLSGCNTPESSESPSRNSNYSKAGFPRFVFRGASFWQGYM